MEKSKPLIVKATWDDEAKVWVATSNDILGLVTEAESMDAMVKKLQVIIPELLERRPRHHRSSLPRDALKRPS